MRENRAVDPLSDLTAALNRINSQPAFPAELRCGVLAAAAIRTVATGTVPQATIPAPISQLLGVRIMADKSMEPTSWKLLDTEGRTMHEGAVSIVRDPVPLDDDGTGFAEYEPGPWRPA